MQTLSASSEGIGDSTDLNVTQRGAGANMSVDVSSGRCLVRGDEGSVQGTYHCVNDATVNLAIGAADPTNPRWDLVVAKVQDALYSGAVNAWSLAIVPGTAAGSPADPAVPNNAIVLARVVVGAAVSSITNANITDLRPRAFGASGPAIVNSARRPGVTYGPGVPFTGLRIYEADTDRMLVRNAAGAWVTITPVSATIATEQTFSTTSYGNLGTTGPQVTVTTGTKALLIMHAEIYASVATSDGFISIDVTGATTLAAIDANGVRQTTGNDTTGGDWMTAQRTFLLTGLTAGSNTFTLKYKAEVGGTIHFRNRDLTVIGVP